MFSKLRLCFRNLGYVCKTMVMFAKLRLCLRNLGYDGIKHRLCPPNLGYDILSNYLWKQQADRIRARQLSCCTVLSDTTVQMGAGASTAANKLKEGSVVLT